MRTLEIRPGWRTDGTVPNPGPFARPPTRGKAFYPVRHPGPDSSSFSGHNISSVPSRDPATGAACLTKEGSLGSFPTSVPSTMLSTDGKRDSVFSKRSTTHFALYPVLLGEHAVDRKELCGLRQNNPKP